MNAEYTRSLQCKHTTGRHDNGLMDLRLVRSSPFPTGRAAG